MDEYIGTESFESYFKDAARDFFVYGYKVYDSFAKGRNTISQYWGYLESILNGEWQFDTKDEDNHSRLRMMPTGRDSADSIDDLYQYHNISYFGSCLNYLLNMDAGTYLNHDAGDIETLIDESINDDNIKANKEAVLMQWSETAFRPHADSDADIVRINTQLGLMTDLSAIILRRDKKKIKDHNNKKIDKTDIYKNQTTQLRFMESLGLIYNLKNYPKKLSEILNALSAPNLNPDKNRDNYWFKSQVTMKKLVGIVMDQVGVSEQEAAQRFGEMLDLFKGYFTLGEVGSIIRRRCENIYNDSGIRYFEFGHSYLMESLYDYNLIDLLVAMENGYFCLVKYNRRADKDSVEKVIIPLQIRISSDNGREYIMYYDIEDKKILALRLEFIERIIMYEDVKQIESSDHKVIYEDTNIDTLNRRLEIAKKMLERIWGVSTENTKVSSNWEKRLVESEIVLQYDKEKEYFILDRVKKEVRGIAEIIVNDGKGSMGTITIKVKSFPTREIRGWVRTFYKRVVKAHIGKAPKDTEDFRFENDSASMNSLYDEKGRKVDKSDVQYSITKKNHKSNTYKIYGKKVPASEGHASLFNSFFGKDAIVLADAFLKGGTQESKIKEELKKSGIGGKKSDALLTYAEKGGLIKNGEALYITSAADYLYDFLPLTRTESRWLISVLKDDLSSIFFEENVREELIKVLSHPIPEVELMPMKVDAVRRFDIHSGSSESHGNNDTIRKIYQAMHDEHYINVKQNNGKDIKCRPVRIEYSVKDDVFRLWYYNKKADQVMKINVPRIHDVEILDDRFRLSDEQEKADASINKPEHKYEIAVYFRDIRRIPDRILTEFSLWDKDCYYDPIKKVFTLKIRYNDWSDTNELVLRLMAYGPYIYIVSDRRLDDREEGPVLEKIKKNLEAQRDVCKSIEPSIRGMEH